MKNALLITVLLFTLNAYASIYTVDNNYPSMGDYTSLQATHDAANPGDTIIMFPSSFAYSGLVVTKQLSIYGSGWINSPTVKTCIVSGSIAFNSGSQGSRLMGIYSYPNDLIINIAANNVSILRNRISKITISSNVLASTILNNFIYHETQDPVIEIGDNTNSIIQNNLIINAYSYVPATAVLTGEYCQLEFLNNIVKAGVTNYLCDSYFAIHSTCTGTIANNIFIYGKISTNANCTMNNILSCADWPYNSNLVNVNYDQLFINQAAGNYHLQPNSVASGSGYGGTDMGIYGGDFPFIDGGYPDLPAIYYLNVPSQASKQGGVNVTIKAKTNN